MPDSKLDAAALRAAQERAAKPTGAASQLARPPWCDRIRMVLEDADANGWKCSRASIVAALEVWGLKVSKTTLSDYLHKHEAERWAKVNGRT